MLCLVGNSPSSGSTLLADLLDSTPFSVCGPELEFFCNRSLYAYRQFKQNLNKSSRVHSLRSTGLFFKSQHLRYYGLDEDRWNDMILRNRTLRDFTTSFTSSYLQYRQKDSNGIVFEKTPQNINAIDCFLPYFSESYFIHIVRKPTEVYHSLLKRGWGKLSALVTWMLYEAKFFPYRNHPRVITIRYEDLINDPAKTVIDILKQVAPDRQITADELMEGFESNTYRQWVAPSLPSWKHQDRSTVIRKEKKIPLGQMKEVATLLDATVNDWYARIHDMAQVTFEEMLLNYGYDELVDNLKSLQDSGTSLPRPEVKDLSKILAKWLRSLKRGYGKPSDIVSYLQPLQYPVG